MYPLTCEGGYPIPVKRGTFEICLIRATIKDTTRDARLILIDDLGIEPDDNNGRILASSSQQATRLCDEKTTGNTGSRLEVRLYEPIKVRRGLSVVNTTNLQAGSIFVFIK
jgi:hypothetical protein